MTTPYQLVPGHFVRLTQEGAIGKFESRSPNGCTVRLFYGPNDIERRLCPVTDLQPAELWPRALVFGRTSWGGALRPGRIVGRQPGPGQRQYEVQFASGPSETVDVADLDVISPDAEVDVTGMLGAGAFEGPTVHDRRLAALRALIGLRAAARGHAGLLSASVELLPHQIDVVSRILDDPIQRYLLADEVGLGKTIEAGIILRQFLIDDRSSRGLVLVPEPLVGQWWRELTGRLHIDEFGDRVQILPFSSLSQVDPEACDILVVDEAHLLVESSGSGGANPPTSDQYRRLATMAHNSRGVLLLSAIPVIGNERAMLGMLHLLDPVVHQLDRPDDLRRKVEQQEEIAGHLLRLDPDSGLPDLLLVEDIQEIAAALPNDRAIQEIARDATVPCGDVRLGVRQLRDHLAETYRLHHRLVRTRRADLEVQGEGTAYGFLPRMGEVTVVVDADPALGALRAELEEWRTASRSDAAIPESIRGTLAARYAALVEAYGRGVREFILELKRQRDDARAGSLPTFAGETEIVAAIRRQFQNNDPKGTRSVRYPTPNGWRTAILPGPHRVLVAVAAITSLLEAVQQDGQRTPRVVAFSSSKAFARHIVACLRKIMGDAAVSSVLNGDESEDVEAAIRQFAGIRDQAVLVCDQAGEHGLNLQFAHGIVHLDLPLSPTRVEQRIGRIDRFGRKSPTVRQAVVVSDDGPALWSGGWLSVLRDGFRVFDTPVSDVQFLLERLEPEIRDQIYGGGPRAFVALADALTARLEAERHQLESQYLLNRVAFGMAGGLELMQHIRDAEARELELEDRIDDWIRNVVGLKRTNAMIDQGWHQYAWSQSTSLPGHGWKPWLAPALAHRWTYRRSVSMVDSRARLVRPGSELLRCLEPLLEDHDEGRTFGIWRSAPSAGLVEGDVRLVFRLVFRVQGRVGDGGGTPLDSAEARERASLQRRADRYLPPSVETLYLDRDLTRIVDPALLEILEQPWSSKAREDGGRDYLFGTQPEMLETAIGLEQFAGLCKRLETQAQQELYKDELFRQRLIEAADWAEADLQRRQVVLGRRQDALKRIYGREDLTIPVEIKALRCIVDALRAPSIVLDAAGVILVAGRPPWVPI